MGKALIGNFSNSAVTSGVNTTRYASLNLGVIIDNATEVQSQEITRLPGTLSGLSARVITNTLSTATTTMRSRVATANGNQVISFAAGVTGYVTDSSNTDAIVDGNLIDTSYVVASGGSGSIETQGILMNFKATTNHATLLGCRTDGFVATGASTTWYLNLSGYDDGQFAENDVKVQIDVGGTLSKGHAYVVTNTRAQATTVQSRVNNADGNISISCTGSTTGLFEDTSNTDTLTAGDDVNVRVTTGTGTGNCVFNFVTIGYVNSTNAKANVYTHLQNFVNTRAASATVHYYPVLGATRLASNTSEPAATMDVGFASVASNLKIYLIASTYTVAGTFISRKAGADGSQTIALTALTSGLFEDVTNTDTLSATDDLCAAISGGTTGSITIGWTGMLIQDTTSYSTIKAINGLAKASVKTVNSLAIASVKTWNGLA